MTALEASTATVPQLNVIKALTRQIWDVEWLILDDYGDGDTLDRELAHRLIDALQDVKKLPLDQLDDGEKLDLLTKALAGETLTDSFPSPSQIDSDIPSSIEDSSGDVAEPEQAFNGRHGTLSAWKHHKAVGEEPCEKCRRFGPRDVRPPAAMEDWAQEPEVEGLDAAENATSDRSTPNAEPKEAPTPATNKPRQRGLQPIVHGTANGHDAHKRRGEEPCAACVEAKRQRSRAYYEQSKRGRPTKQPNGARKPRKTREPKPTLVPSLTDILVEWKGHLFDTTVHFLTAELPALDQPFPKDRQDAWLKIARSMFEMLWPET